MTEKDFREKAHIAYRLMTSINYRFCYVISAIPKTYFKNIKYKNLTVLLLILPYP